MPCPQWMAPAVLNAPQSPIWWAAAVSHLRGHSRAGLTLCFREQNFQPRDTGAAVRINTGLSCSSGLPRSQCVCVSFLKGLVGLRLSVPCKEYLDILDKTLPVFFWFNFILHPHSNTRWHARTHMHKLLSLVQLEKLFLWKNILLFKHSAHLISSEH